MKLARAPRGEEGFAMVVAVVLLAVMATLSALVLASGSHTVTATGRGRSWAQSMHVAEAGMENAIARIEAAGGAFSGSLTGSTADGTYSVTVTRLARNRWLLDSTGTVAAAAGLGQRAERKLRVTLAPPRSFRYALLSDTSVDTKNNDHIIGDVWANQNVIVDDGDLVEGSVTAATGWIELENGSRVSGDVLSGGYNPETGRAIYLESGARVDGNATSAATVPPASANCRTDHVNYKVRLDGNGSLPAQVGGNVTACGPKTGSGTVTGTITQGTYTAAPPTKTLPTFTYSASNYDPLTLHPFGTPSVPSATAVSDFQSYVSSHASALSGTFYVNQQVPVNQGNRIDLTGVTIAGDTTIVTNAPIFTNGNSASTADAIVVLVSTYQPPASSECDVNQDSSECSIHLKNNFQVSGTSCDTAAAALVYAPYGPVAVKNNATQCGTIYADNIQIKNNQTLAYDERVERIVGFGEVTLEIASWIECLPAGC